MALQTGIDRDDGQPILDMPPQQQPLKNTPTVDSPPLHDDQHTDHDGSKKNLTDYSSNAIHCYWRSASYRLRWPWPGAIFTGTIRVTSKRPTTPSLQRGSLRLRRK